MKVLFVLLEALIVIAVPAVLAVCVKLIIRDAKQEKAKHKAELEMLRATMQEHLRKSAQDVNKAREQMEAYFMRHINTRRREEAIAAKREPGSVQWFVGIHQLPPRGRRPPKEWRQ